MPGTVAYVAGQFGEVRTTGWGTVFDVRAVADANSVAYTNLPLVTHTDEAYRDPAPTIQLQHFLRADAEGGETTLVDGFKVAADLRAERPDLFELLATVSLHFHFRDDDNEHEHDAPVIELDTAGEVRAIRYSNHSAQPFLLPRRPDGGVLRGLHDVRPDARERPVSGDDAARRRRPLHGRQPARPARPHRLPQRR